MDQAPENKNIDVENTVLKPKNMENGSMGINVGKKFRFETVGGFTVTKQVKLVNESGQELAFVKDNLKGDILTTELNVTADKKGENVLFTYRNGDFVSVYGEKLGEVYAKTFRCRKALLIKMSDGREFRLRTDHIWKGWFLLPQTYFLEGPNGVEATYKFTTSKFGCEVAENATLPAEILVTLGAAMMFKALYVVDAKDLSRVMEAEDADDVKDARLVWRLSALFGLLMLAAFLLKCIALLFDK